MFFLFFIFLVILRPLHCNMFCTSLWWFPGSNWRKFIAGGKKNSWWGKKNCFFTPKSWKIWLFCGVKKKHSVISYTKVYYHQLTTLHVNSIYNNENFPKGNSRWAIRFKWIQSCGNQWESFFWWFSGTSQNTIPVEQISMNDYVILPSICIRRIIF